MEDLSLPIEHKTDGGGELAWLLASRREQARQYITAQQRRLGELEATLAHKLGEILQELAQTRQANIETEAELAEARSQLEAAAKKHRLDERGLVQLRREYEANTEELTYNRQRLQQKLTELEIEREELIELHARTKSQRINIAHRLKTQRNETRRYIERHLTQLNRGGSTAAGTGEEHASSPQRAAEPPDAAFLEALSRQVADLERRLLESVEQKLSRPRTGHDEALAEIQRRHDATVEELREQTRRMLELAESGSSAAQSDDLSRQLADLPRHLSDAVEAVLSGQRSAQEKALAEIQTRQEMAMEELREHARRSFELAENRSAAAGADDFSQQLADLPRLLSEMVGGVLSEERSRQDEVLTELQRRHETTVEELRIETLRVIEAQAGPTASSQGDTLGPLLAELEQRILHALEGLRFEPPADQAATATDSAHEGSPDDEGGEALADMRRRYELAMEDLRDQKRRVSELEQKLASAPIPSGHAAPPGKLDWEAQKQRLLAALEADAESDEDSDEDGSRRGERLKMREVIEHTDAALAEKESQIEELQGLLSSQSANIGEVAVGAAAFAEVLSSDEIIRAERERLQQLQQEWEEKLRQAEIDLSVQRAKIARERAEIEERQRTLQHHQTEGGSAISADALRSDKPQRGRWLTRLGLKEEEP